MTTWIEWTDEECTHVGLQSLRIWRWLQDNPDYKERFKYWLKQFEPREFHFWEEVEVWAYYRLHKEATE